VIARRVQIGAVLLFLVEAASVLALPAQISGQIEGTTVISSDVANQGMDLGFQLGYQNENCQLGSEALVSLGADDEEFSITGTLNSRMELLPWVELGGGAGFISGDQTLLAELSATGDFGWIYPTVALAVLSSPQFEAVQAGGAVIIDMGRGGNLWEFRPGDPAPLLTSITEFGARSGRGQSLGIGFAVPTPAMVWVSELDPRPTGIGFSAQRFLFSFPIAISPGFSIALDAQLSLSGTGFEHLFLKQWIQLYAVLVRPEYQLTRGENSLESSFVYDIGLGLDVGKLGLIGVAAHAIQDRMVGWVTGKYVLLPGARLVELTWISIMDAESWCLGNREQINLFNTFEDGRVISLIDSDLVFARKDAIHRGIPYLADQSQLVALSYGTPEAYIDARVYYRDASLLLLNWSAIELRAKYVLNESIGVHAMFQANHGGSMRLEIGFEAWL